MSKITAWFSRSQKAVAAWVGANLTWCQLIALQPHGFRAITAVEWVGLAIANATALGVYAATNTPPHAEAVVKLAAMTSGLVSAPAGWAADASGVVQPPAHQLPDGPAPA